MLAQEETKDLPAALGKGESVREPYGRLNEFEAAPRARCKFSQKTINIIYIRLFNAKKKFIDEVLLINKTDIPLEKTQVWYPGLKLNQFVLESSIMAS